MQKETIEGFRLSPQQKHLWQLQPNQNERPYRVRCAFSIEGNLDPKILKTALQTVVNQHEILRTTFHCLPGMTVPLQAIATLDEVVIAECNLSRLSPVEQAAKIESLFQELRQLPFDFELGDLWHFSLVTIAPEKHLLLGNLSALIADSATPRKLMRELSLSYAACKRGEALSDVPMQYADIAEWQNELLESEEAEIGKEYWRKVNRDRLLHFNLPGEKKVAKQGEFQPQLETLAISGDRLANIEAIAQQYQSDPAAFLLTCWQILIGRLSRQSNFMVGAANDSRKYEELAQSLGLFCTYLPLQCDLQDEFSFAKVWRQVELNLKDIQTWQEYFTWEEILEGDPNNAFFPVCFEFEQVAKTDSDSGVSFFLDRQDACVEPFKLKLSCLHKGNSLVAEFHYDSACFDPEDIKRLSQHFQTLLESAVKNPEASISQLEILSDRDRYQLLVEFNQTQKNYPKNKCIHQLFEEQADRTPDNIAVVFENQQINYRELNIRADRLAHYLHKLGVEPEGIVGICVDRSLEMIVGMLGILKAGGAYLPIDPTTPTERKALMLEDASVQVLLTQQRLVESLPKIQANIVCLDTDIPSVFTSYTPCVSSENLAYIIYTSGSTGTPKGVAIEHRQLLNYLYSIQGRLTLPINANFATVSTFAADLGNTAIFSALCTGGCLHVISQERATNSEALAEYFRCHSIDCLKIVPSHLAALLTSPQAESILPRKRLILGGETASWELIEKIRQLAQDCLIFNHYGPTEATVGVLTYQVEGKKLKGISETVPLGRAIANTQIYILDCHLQPVPINVPGELYIGGDNLARGYLNRPELTVEKFIRHPFDAQARLYKTGDLARYLPDGNVEFLGRIDNQVKIRGFRIELGEIEQTIAQYPDIVQAVVIAREDVPGEKRLVAYLVTNQKPAISNRELRKFLATKLPDYMMPSAFITLKTLPLTPNGKIDRRSLPKPDPSCPEIAENFVAPRTNIEEVLSSIWAEVLRLEKVGIYDNFFELGGHSLLATQVISRLRQSLQVELPLHCLFESPTVADLAVAIAQKQAEQTDSQMLAQMLAELEQLSEAEIQKILAKEGVNQ